MQIHGSTSRLCSLDDEAEVGCACWSLLKLKLERVGGEGDDCLARSIYATEGGWHGENVATAVDHPEVEPH